MNFGVVEIRPARQDSADEDGRIDRRDFGLEHPLAILKVEEVAKKAMRLRHASLNEAQGIHHALAELFLVFPAAMIRNAQTAQAEARCGDAGHVAGVSPVSLAAIFDQPGVGIGLVPKKLEAGAFEFFEKLIFFTGEAIFGRIASEERVGSVGLLRLRAGSQVRPKLARGRL